MIFDIFRRKKKVPVNPEPIAVVAKPVEKPTPSWFNASMTSASSRVAEPVKSSLPYENRDNFSNIGSGILIAELLVDNETREAETKELVSEDSRESESYDSNSDSSSDCSSDSSSSDCCSDSTSSND